MRSRRETCLRRHVYSLRYGYDPKRGGFYGSGRCNAPASKEDKIWWVQAEALISALTMYDLTEEELYWRCFCQTLEWVVGHQVDWDHGDWHAVVGKNGKPSGNKAGAWKSPYHNGRAMIECLELLSSFTDRNSAY
jgi:cellobiose epimerase